MNKVEIHGRVTRSVLSPFGLRGVIRNLIFVVTCLSLASGFAQAQQTTYFFNSIPFHGYEITGYFTVPQPLPPNISLTDGQLFSSGTFTPSDFSFTNGLQTITSNDADYSGFAVNTDNAGNIIQWSFYAGNANLYLFSFYYPGDDSQVGFSSGLSGNYADTDGLGLLNGFWYTQISYPAGVCATNALSQVHISFGGLRVDHATGMFVQPITLTATGSNLSGVSFVLDSLTPGIVLSNASGFTQCNPPLNSPYVALPFISAGSSVTVTLHFTDPKHLPILYQSRVLSFGTP